MAKLDEIARRTGVDISTVSRVLLDQEVGVSDETRERIRMVAQELGMGAGLAEGPVGRVGAIAVAAWSTSNYLYPQIIEGAEEAAERLGYTIFLVKYKSQAHGTGLIDILQRMNVDGLLLVEDLPSEEFASELQKREVPFVGLNRPQGDWPCVILDDAAGCHLQARYIIGLGHRDIAYVGVCPLDSPVSRFCLDCFVDECHRLGVAIKPDRLLACDYHGTQVERTAEDFLRLSPRPTAIVAASVMVAERLTASLRARGLDVPGEVSILGYHDSPAADWGDITTVRMPSKAQGRQAVERLIDVIGGAKVGVELVSDPPAIIGRATCGRPPL